MDLMFYEMTHLNGFVKCLSKIGLLTALMVCSTQNVYQWCMVYELTIWLCAIAIHGWCINPFYVAGLFLFPLKTSGGTERYQRHEMD